MGKITDLANKVNPLNLLKKKPFNAKFMDNIDSQFSLMTMDDINDSIEQCGIQLEYTGNGDRAGLIIINGIKSKRVNDDPIFIFDEATQNGYSVYIMPHAAFKYTIYNRAGQVSATIIYNSGQDSAVKQFVGSKDYFKIEGEIL